MQKALLQSMFFTFSESLNHLDNKSRLEENYENQLACYSRLFDLGGDDDEARRSLICARCLISATRSLLYNGYLSENVSAIRRELDSLSPVFSGKQMTKKDLAALIDKRISHLTPKKSDEMVDAVLFMCISMAPKSYSEEKSLDRKVL